MKIKECTVTFLWHTDSEACEDHEEDVCAKEECGMPSAASIFLVLISEDDEVVEEFHCHTCINHMDDPVGIAVSTWQRLWANNKEIPE